MTDDPEGTNAQLLANALLRAEIAEKALAAARLEGRTPEDEAERFIQAAIDNAPEPLRRLGEWLANMLDDDQFKTADRMLLGACAAAASARAEGWKAGRDAAAKVVLNHYIGPATSRAANYREANVTRPVLATAILALEAPRHE